MTRLSRYDNEAIATHWLTIISNNPLNYPYFCEHFAHTIDFFNKATLTYTYDDDPDRWSILYSHYSHFLNEYRELFNFIEEDKYLKKNWNNVTISLPIVMLEHFKWKMQVNTDILKPHERYDDQSMYAYINQYFKNQKDIYDYNLKNLLFTVEEVFTFKNPEIKSVLQKMGESSNGHEMLDTILNATRYAKGHPEQKDTMKEMFFWINPDNIDYNLKAVPNQILAYILFNLIFLEKQYFLYRTWEVIRMWDDTFSDWVLVDKFTLDKIMEWWNSGVIIQSSLPLKTFNNFMDDQETFQTLKKEIVEEYRKLSQGTESKKETLEKVMRHIEDKIQDFSKTEFYIGTKNQSVSFVESIVTESDKKKYYEIQKKLWTETYENKEWRRIFKKKTKIEDIEK